MAKKQNESKSNRSVSAQPRLHQRALRFNLMEPSATRCRSHWKNRCECR
jgi:hypothetical protein